MKNLVIAKRYAKAFFNLARQEKKIDAYGEELAGFVELLNKTPELADAIQNPLYPLGTRKALFQQVADSLGLTPIMRSFVNLLIEKKRVQNIDEIKDFYGRLIDEAANVARAQVRAAVKLDEQAIEDIKSSLAKITQKEIVVEFQQDPALIGGVVAQIGDLILDGSVRTQLLSIKESLKRGELG